MGQIEELLVLIKADPKLVLGCVTALLAMALIGK